MLFNTAGYAYFFATVLVASWLLAPWRRWRLGFLLVSSYFFYAGWTFVGWERLVASHGLERWRLLLESVKYVPLLFVGTSIDYYLGLALDRTSAPRRRKALCVATILVNVGILVFFKYWNWGVDSAVWLADRLFGAKLPDVHLRVELPIGISFFCFMSLSYVVDVYRGTMRACRSYLDYLTYISFFPHLVAGPIIRGRDLLPHLERPTRLGSETGAEGLFLVATGLFKKVVIGDYLAINFVDRVFAEPSSFSAVEVLTALYAYAVQIYCDFSGYSDIAIGSALLLGYRFKINFDAPFKAPNLIEFWRRWHVSLSTWLRDYVYIPLGGGQHGRVRKYVNVLATMVLCGIWHGAGWTYVLFGAVHGVGLVATHLFHDLTGRKPAHAARRAATQAIGAFFTFSFFALSLLLFRAPTLDKATLLVGRMATLTTYTFNLSAAVLLVIAGALLMQWAPRRLYDRAREAFTRAPAPVQALALLALFVVLREAASTEAVPFVYFQF
jgi:D-alanyl-lipoteichoic acid acyltransferase DltB (MBOAT superfamily)